MLDDIFEDLFDDAGRGRSGGGKSREAMSGRKVLATIDDTLRQARGALSGLDTRSANATTELARIGQAEVAVFAQLAKLRLLAIERSDLPDVLDAADQRAAELLGERKRGAAELARNLETAEAELAASEKRRAAQQAAVQDASEAVDVAEAEAQAKLGADEAYEAQLAATEHADFIADQAEDKAKSARRDRTEKGRPYEDDALFAYLWSRGYGTSGYRASPWTRWLDGWVAKVCDYEPARRNYWMLTEIPLRLDEHARTMRARFDTAVEALRELEQRAAEAANVPALQASLEAAEQKLDEIDASIVEQEERVRALVEERGRYGSGDDDYYRGCLDTLKEALRRESVQFLAERAARTRDPEDDALVNRLGDLERERERVMTELEQIRRLREAQSERLSRFEEIRRQFKQRRYDDAHSVFRDAALVVLVLNQFLSGAVGVEDVWDVIRREHRQRRAHGDPRFGTLRFPHAPKGSPWRMPRGSPFGKGGLGGGGFRRGGGFGGGGFKTGGGF